MTALKYAAATIVVVAFLLLLAFVDGAIGGGAGATTTVGGMASNYPQTAGFAGQATVALPSSLGGRYDGTVYAHVTVCGDRCVTLPAVDWCECVVPGSAHPNRIIDLSHAAWPLVTDTALSAGLVEVTVTAGAAPLPDTAFDPGDLIYTAWSFFVTAVLIFGATMFFGMAIAVIAVIVKGVVESVRK